MRTIERDDWTPEVAMMADGARVVGLADDDVVVRAAGSYQFEEHPDGSLVAREFTSRRDRRRYTRMTLGL